VGRGRGRGRGREGEGEVNLICFNFLYIVELMQNARITAAKVTATHIMATDSTINGLVTVNARAGNYGLQVTNYTLKIEGIRERRGERKTRGEN
jgi:hypothetical protein